MWLFTGGKKTKPFSWCRPPKWPPLLVLIAFSMIFNGLLPHRLIPCFQSLTVYTFIPLQENPPPTDRGSYNLSIFPHPHPQPGQSGEHNGPVARGCFPKPEIWFQKSHHSGTRARKCRVCLGSPCPAGWFRADSNAVHHSLWVLFTWEGKTWLFTLPSVPRPLLVSYPAQDTHTCTWTRTRTFASTHSFNSYLLKLPVFQQLTSEVCLQWWAKPTRSLQPCEAGKSGQAQTLTGWCNKQSWGKL